MPIIEEINDDEIDNQHFSIDDFDEYNPFSKDTYVDPDAPVQLRPTEKALKQQKPQPPKLSEPAPKQINQNARMPEHMKKWAVIYPIYLDKHKTVKQGRRVSTKIAVENPLAVLISDACQHLGYQSALEIQKTHPNDWSNPGRVRVDIPSNVAKSTLYPEICMYLKLHPADNESAREQMYKQIAQFDSLEPLASLRGEKLHKVLPGVSPALSARKVLEEMMPF